MAGEGAARGLDDGGVGGDRVATKQIQAELTVPFVYECRWCGSVPPGKKESQPLTRPPDGPCPHCGGLYNHKRISVAEDDVDGTEAAKLEEGEPVSAADLFKVVGNTEKVPTGLSGFDHVFNGGLPRLGGAILLTAPAGTGKTTLAYALLRSLAERDVKSIFVSSEQSLPDLGQQLAWLGPPSKKCARHMLMHHERDRDEIIYQIERSRAKVAVVDSLHAVESVTDSDGAPLASGHPSAVAQAADDFKRLAGEREMTVICMGHMNSDGFIAGGNRVKHVLDATLVLRPGKGERDPRRVLEIEGKNRLAPRGRRALFMMTATSFEDHGPLPDEDEAA